MSENPTTRFLGNAHAFTDDLISGIIGISEDPKVPKFERLGVALAFARRFIADRPGLVEFVKDDLLAAALAGRASNSKWMLTAVRIQLFESKQ